LENPEDLSTQHGASFVLGLPIILYINKMGCYP